MLNIFFFFFSSRRRHTRLQGDWSSDVCSSDLYFCDVLDEEVRARFEEALDRLRAAGAHIDEIEIHHATDLAAVYLHIVLGDAAAYHAVTLETMPDRYTTPVRLRLEMGRYVLAEDYVRALAGRERLR